MEALTEVQLDQIFRAIADSTRRKIMKLILKKSMSVTEIASHFDISLNGVSKHLKILEKAGILKRTKDGRTYHCQTNPIVLSEAYEFLSFYKKFWNESLDNLETYFNKK